MDIRPFPSGEKVTAENLHQSFIDGTLQELTARDKPQTRREEREGGGEEANTHKGAGGPDGAPNRIKDYSLEQAVAT